MRVNPVSAFAKTLLSCGIVMILAFIILAGSSFANPPLNKLSPEYLAGFAFFKFAKATPDFETWIKASSRYKAATPRERVVMLRSEAPMMAGYFNAYVPKENPIEMKVRVKYSAPKTKAADKMLTEEGVVKIPMKIVGTQEGFFPVEVGDMWIAMIPGNLEEMMTLTFDKEEYATFKRQASSGLLGNNVEAVVQLALLPTSADVKAPMEFQGFNLWMLGVRIIDLELWDAKEERMIWYVEGQGSEKRRNSDQIFNLYEN